VPRPRFTGIQGTDTSRIQREIERAFIDFTSVASAKVLEEKTIGTAETRVAHGMGEVPQHWGVLSAKGPASVYETKRPDSQFLYLAASVEVVCSLLVF